MQHIKIYDHFLPVSLCKKVIERFEGDARVQPDPQPNYSTRQYLNISLCREWLAINAELCRYVHDATARNFKQPDELAHGTYHEWSDDGYVVSRYSPGDSCILHVDGQSPVAPNNGFRIATVIFYLNDVAEGSGGELHFPLQDLKIRPVQGRGVVFPVGYTHPHAVLETKAPRYMLQTWITDPQLIVGLRDHEL